jgi:hypothetical protein
MRAHEKAHIANRTWTGSFKAKFRNMVVKHMEDLGLCFPCERPGVFSATSLRSRKGADLKSDNSRENNISESFRASVSCPALVLACTDLSGTCKMSNPTDRLELIERPHHIDSPIRVVSRMTLMSSLTLTCLTDDSMASQLAQARV